MGVLDKIKAISAKLSWILDGWLGLSLAKILEPCKRLWCSTPEPCMPPTAAAILMPSIPNCVVPTAVCTHMYSLFYISSLTSN